MYMMNVIPPPTPTDLQSAVPMDDPYSVNSPWNQSFMSLLMMGDQQIPPPADSDLSSPDSFPRRTLDLGVKSQSTHEEDSSSVKSQSTRSDLWSSEEEEANYLASLGLGVTSSVDVEDSWSMMEEQMLRTAMADNMLMEKPVIPWERIAEALPWRTPLEVFNRTNQLLQTIQRDLSTVITSQQQQQQQKQAGVIMSPPSPEEEEEEEEEEERQQKQQIRRRVRKRWSEEEDGKFRVGVKRYGWGNWKMVATLIPGRTVPQVTSHAQMYIRKHTNHPLSCIPKPI